jgi:alpha-L-rhamnosidase
MFFSWKMRNATKCAFVGLLIAVGLCRTGGAAYARAQVIRTRCEQAVDPIGIGTISPRLDWAVTSGRRGDGQTAYQILVASSKRLLVAGKADLLDTGKVPSDASANVVYCGKPMHSREHCWWKVRVWGRDGRASAFSKISYWETGLLDPADWKAQWIEIPGKKAGSPASYIRKPFAVAKQVKEARLYSTALGLYEIYLNGRRVSDDVFAPGWTEYRKRVQYQTYDVTRLVRSGKNALGMILGDGWYCGYVGTAHSVYGTSPKALSQLEIRYEDGTTETVGTDETWKTSTGPILESDLYMGETYDARKEIPGWSAPEFDDSKWQPVSACDVKISLDAQRGPSVRRTGLLKPKSVTEPKKGVFVFDMGQNMVGWARLRVKGTPGSEVVLRFGEVLDKDGTAFTKNYRTAKCIDRYVLRGGEAETYEPHFTYRGFRYVEVTGYPGTPSIDDVSGVVVNSDMPITGSFVCSNPEINQLQSNIAWGQRGNYLSVPTDCPQRDERLGWSGDAQAFIRTATFNMEIQSFYNKWLRDYCQDAQQENGVFRKTAPDMRGRIDGVPGWSDAGVICPWTIYLCYGDTRVIEENYSAMQAWIEYCKVNSRDLIRPTVGYGDWCSWKSDSPKDVIATAYFAYSTHLLSKMASAIGKADDARKYQDLFERIRTAFDKEYVSPDGRVKGETQTVYAMALYFDLLPAEKRALAASHLADDVAKRGWHLSTGFLGTGYLLPSLSMSGRDDVAYRLIEQDTLPSWGYQIKLGATTMWELWNGMTEDGISGWQMNSFNHYAFGSVGEWIYSVIGGIDPDPEKPGYKHVIIRPRPGGGLTFARATLDSVYGKIGSDWHIEDGRFKLNVTIPFNVSSTVYVPTSDASTVLVDGYPASKVNGVKFVKHESGSAVYEVGSGRYAFTARTDGESH